MTPVVTLNDPPSSPCVSEAVVDSATLVIGVTITCDGLTVETPGETRVEAGVGDCAAPGVVLPTINQTLPISRSAPMTVESSAIRVNSRRDPSPHSAYD